MNSQYNTRVFENPAETGQDRRLSGRPSEQELPDLSMGNRPRLTVGGESSFIAVQRLPTEEADQSEGTGDEPKSCEQLDESWQRVPGRTRYRNRYHGTTMAERTAIIWGFRPANQSLLGLSIALQRRGVVFENLRRGDVGSHQYVEITFASSTDREARLGHLQTVCRTLHLKAVKARNFGLRERHRQLREKPATPPRREVVDQRSATSSSQAGADRLSPQLSLRDYYGPIAPAEGPATEIMQDTCVDGHLPPTAVEHDHSPVSETSTSVRSRYSPMLTMGTHNWNGSAFDDSIIRGELYKSKDIDVLAVTDHRIKDSYLSKLSVEGYHWIPGRCPDDVSISSGGVGFLVRRFLRGLVTELEPSFKNQKWIRLAPIAGAGVSRPLYIGAAYMPQEGAADAEEAWASLDADVAKYGALGEVVLLGDLNAKIGQRRPGEERCLGKHCDTATRTRNGESLIRMAMGHGLRVVNSFSKPKGDEEAHWTTRKDPATGHESQLDYILLSDLDNAPPELEVCREDGGSDHWLVYAKVLFPMRREKARKPHRYQRVRSETLIDLGGRYRQPLPVWSTQTEEDTPKQVNQSRAAYVSALEKELRGYEPNEAKVGSDTIAFAGDLVNDICSRILAAARQSLEIRTVAPAYRKPWFDKDCRQAIDKRRALYQVWLKSEDDTDYKSYRESLRQCRRLIKAKKVAYREERTRRLQHEADASSHRFWCLVDKELGSKKHSGSSHTRIQRQDGTLTTSSDDCREAWAEYQEKLGTPPQDAAFDTKFFDETNAWAEDYMRSSQEDPDPSIARPFKKGELVSALKKLKHHKAPGMDKIGNELLKYGGHSLCDALLKLFNRLLDLEVFPKDWGKAACVQLYKSGDRTDPSNYRGIALISCLGKLYLSLWAERLTGYAEGRLSRLQGGFRPNRGCRHLVYSLYDTLVRRKRSAQTSYLFFIDLKKAFDTVWWNGLLKALYDIGIKGKAWRVIRNVYSDIQVSTLLEGRPSRWVPSTVGVRQGCPLSPVLFNIYINSLAVKLEELAATCGVEIVGDWLSALLYADDIVAISHSREGLQRLMDEVDAWCRKWRLRG